MSFDIFRDDVVTQCLTTEFYKIPPGMEVGEDGDYIAVSLRTCTFGRMTGIH